MQPRGELLEPDELLDLVGWIAVGGTWASVMVSLGALHLASRRHTERKVDDLVQMTRADHLAVNRQIADMGATIAREYVTTREFTEGMGNLRRDIGEVRSRIDRVLDGGRE